MTLEEFNSMTNEEAFEALIKCCHSQKFAHRIVEDRPYKSDEQFLGKVENVWFSLDIDEWKDAYKAHPKIGDISSLKAKYAQTASISANEQNLVNSATEDVITQLAELNDQYYKKNGFIFIVFATGKSAQQMLALLSDRINNSTLQELFQASIEQSKITNLRIRNQILS